MRFARPPSGFKIDLSPGVRDYVDAQLADYPAFSRFWNDMIEYLKIVAHKVGVPEPRLGADCRLFATGPDPELGQPRIFVGYLVMGETVYIRLLHVSRRESD